VTGAAVVRAASLVRGERVIHAEGTTLAGRLLVPGGAALGVPLLDQPGRHDCLVRFSRSLGLPDRLPDVLGVAVRVLDAHGPDAHQDLLLDSSGRGARRGLRCPRDALGTLFSSLTPYELGGGAGCSACSRPRRAAPAGAEVAGARRRRAAAAGGGAGHGRARGACSSSAGPGGRQLRFSPDVTGAGSARRGGCRTCGAAPTAPATSARTPEGYSTGPAARRAATPDDDGQPRQQQGRRRQRQQRRHLAEATSAISAAPGSRAAPAG
jgi:hypothetical protein